MKVAIGSTNPVKINAVKYAFKKAYKNCEFVGLEAESEISDQPIGEEVTRKGAFNRAKNVLKKAKADFGIGLEGGVMETEFGMMTSAWCCIIDKKGKASYGGGMNFHLPEIVAEKIRNGGELGPIMDELLNEKDWKKKGGAIEIFTGGLLSRTKAYQRLVEMALTKFVASQWYR